MMTPKTRHPIIDRVDKLKTGQSAIISSHDYAGYTSLRLLLRAYYQAAAVPKKFKITLLTTQPKTWQIERLQ